jgi:phage anti-repressor protein
MNAKYFQERLKKYKFIENHWDYFSVEKMCRVMKINSGCYYTWKKHPLSQRAREGVDLKIAINRVFEASFALLRKK